MKSTGKYRRRLDAYFREGSTERQRRRAKRILFGKPLRPPLARKYDPEVHPAGIVAYFEEAYQKLKDEAESVVTNHGDKKYIAKPLRAPSMAGYALRAEVSVKTLSEWADGYEEFRVAYERAKTIQEAFIFELAAMNGLNPHVALMALKNYQGWREKAEIDLTGKVALHFDRQDEGA